MEQLQTLLLLSVDGLDAPGSNTVRTPAAKVDFNIVNSKLLCKNHSVNLSIEELLADSDTQS